jgi:hypothetical protein
MKSQAKAMASTAFQARSGQNITTSRKYVDKGDVTGVMPELWENKEIAVMEWIANTLSNVV